MVRYGSIRYVNNLPVDLGLVSGQVPRPRGLEVLEGTPAELNAAWASGRVDVSAVSAALLTEGAEDLCVLPEATIASHGPVDSVLLVSKMPFDSLDGRRVTVSEESATGALMLRILLERDLGIRPAYAPMRSDLDAMLRDADAALLIGDDALRLSAGRNGAPPATLDGYEVLDLGEAWRAYTGLPMVYAVWVARNGVAETDPEGVAALRRSLTASREWGTTHMEEVLAEAARRTGVTEQVLRTYYDRLTHTLGPREADGLRRFLAEAAALDRREPPSVEVPGVEVVS